VKISAFSALRPVRDKVHLVATRPYYSYKKNVLKAKLEDNPFTFLHIINPEFGSEVKTKPNSTERFDLVKKQYQLFIDKGILIQEASPRLYLYRQSKGGHISMGIIGGASLDDYQKDTIKKHEATLTSREAMFTDYLEQVGYNAEPVLIAYADQNNIDQLIAQYSLQRPEYEFTTTDRITHELWVLSPENTSELQTAFESVPVAYIADGHHRSASSARLFKNRQDAEQAVKNAGNFLAYFVPESNLSILEFNRLVKDLKGYSATTFLHALSALGELKELKAAEKPKQEHEITLFIDQKWYSLTFLNYLIDENHPVNGLDSSLLTELILSPLLGITDLKTTDRVTFSPGSEDLSLMEELITSNKFAVGFVLYPATFLQIKKVADHQLNMPPKSTYVEPKLRSGLTIYDINQ
jgi:uncharacterized protein (DUF1015 family)